MPKKKLPQTFDAWLGKVIDDEAVAHGGRATLATWLGVSEQTINRRARGEVSYTVKDVHTIAAHLGIPASEIVERALSRYGGLDKLLAESVSDLPPSLEAHRAKKKTPAEMTEEELEGLSNAANTDPEHEADEPELP